MNYATFSTAHHSIFKITFFFSLKIHSNSIQGCYISRFCLDSSIRDGSMDASFAQNPLLVHCIALLVVACWFVVVAYSFGQSIGHFHCRSQRFQTTSRLKRSFKSYRVLTLTPAFSQIWSKNGSTLIRCVFI